MKEEIKRILMLVEEGKLSREDAAELIEAFTQPDEDDEDDAQTTTDKPEDPFRTFFESIERVGHDVAKSIDWKDVAAQVRKGVGKGVEAVKKAADDAKSGKGFNIFGAHETKRVELPLHIEQGKTLRIENLAGDVHVRGGHEVGSLAATATFRAMSTEDARKKADLYIPVLEESDRAVLLKQPEGHDLSVDVDVQVGMGVPIEIKTGSGDITVEGTGGSCRIEGRSGDIRVSGVTGAVTVSTASGDTTIEDASDATIEIETKSGSVLVRKAEGTVSVRASSGSVRLEQCDCSTVSAEVASGHLYLDMLEPVDGAVDLRAVNGSVTAEVPDGSDCSVKLSTLRGTVHSELELADESREAQRITGRLGEGRGSLQASTVSGDVTLRLRDASK